MDWRWALGGVLAIAVGLTVWVTAFILVPAGIVLVIIGLVRAVRTRRSG